MDQEERNPFLEIFPTDQFLDDEISPPAGVGGYVGIPIQTLGATWTPDPYLMAATLYPSMFIRPPYYFDIEATIQDHKFYPQSGKSTFPSIFKSNLSGEDGNQLLNRIKQLLGVDKDEPLLSSQFRRIPNISHIPDIKEMINLLTENSEFFGTILSCYFVMKSIKALEARYTILKCPHYLLPIDMPQILIFDHDYIDIVMEPTTILYYYRQYKKLAALWRNDKMMNKEEFMHICAKEEIIGPGHMVFNESISSNIIKRTEELWQLPYPKSVVIEIAKNDLPYEDNKYKFSLNVAVCCAWLQRKIKQMENFIQ